jgi:6-phosphogluconolactonase (cycloisomerase 2 family)
VQAFRIERTTGALTAIAQQNVTGINGHDLAITPNGKFLYVADWQTPGLVGFTIDNSGALHTNPAVNVSGLYASTFVAVAPSGDFLYLGSLASANSAVITYRVDPTTGALTEVSRQQFGTDLPGGAVTGDGAFLVVGDLYGAMAIYRLDPTGVPVQLSTVQVSSAIGRMFAIGRNIYAVLPAAVGAFHINDDGSVTPLATAAVADGACAIAADHSGQLLYVTTQAPDGSSGAIYGFHVTANGSVTAVAGSPWSIPSSDSCSAAVVSH